MKKKNKVIKECASCKKILTISFVYSVATGSLFCNECYANSKSRAV